MADDKLKTGLEEQQARSPPALPSRAALLHQSSQRRNIPARRPSTEKMRQPPRLERSLI